MKRTPLLCAAALSCSLLASATPTLISGTPGNAILATPTGPSLRFSQIINFDELTPNTTLDPSQYSSQGVASISSPNGLTVIPFSTQSAPNEIFDNGANGTATISLKLSHGTNEIGIGIADADPVTVTLQPLDLNGSPFGSAFSVTIPADTDNPFNAYYAIADTGYTIGGLEVLQTSADPSFSGLAIDDLQVGPIPEPASLLLAGAGFVAFGLICLQKRRNKK